MFAVQCDIRISIGNLSQDGWPDERGILVTPDCNRAAGIVFLDRLYHPGPAHRAWSGSIHECFVIGHPLR